MHRRKPTWGKGSRLSWPARHVGRLDRAPLFRRGAPEGDGLVRMYGAWPIGLRRRMNVLRRFDLRRG
jgi:hypothetical protein